MERPGKRGLMSRLVAEGDWRGAVRFCHPFLCLQPQDVQGGILLVEKTPGVPRSMVVFCQTLTNQALKVVGRIKAAHVPPRRKRVTRGIMKRFGCRPVVGSAYGRGRPVLSSRHHRACRTDRSWPRPHSSVPCRRGFDHASRFAVLYETNSWAACGGSGSRPERCEDRYLLPSPTKWPRPSTGANPVLDECREH